MRSGIGVGVPPPIRTPSGAVSAGEILATLFGSGEAGAVYDLAEADSLYQDAAGTTPALVANGDPLGRLSDLTGNGNHFTQTTGGDRPDLGTDEGRPGIVWAPAATEGHLTIPGSTSTLQFLHDGTGSTLWFAARFGFSEASRELYSSITLGSHVGIELFYFGEFDEVFQHQVANGTTKVNTGFIASPFDTHNAVQVQLTADNLRFRLNGADNDNGFGVTLNSGNASFDLRLGQAADGGGQVHNAALYKFGFIDRVLTGQEIALLDSYLA